MIAASLQGVGRTYGAGAATVPALRDVYVKITSNRFTVLSGPSGSGKTTMLNLLSGIDRATTGSVVVAGQALETLSDAALSDFRALHIGLVFSVVQFDFGPERLRKRRVPAHVARRIESEATHVTELLEAFGVAPHAHRRPGEISGGQQQRIAIARALVTRPSLVLADEPTANLDSATGAAIIGFMRKM
ncbi:ABC transporter ATP-binding protein YvcR [Candidatus Burkholderia pumila]|uniref:ABC transporter ATP-binding protein YvcR n=1 Tax=Candidatus Burkholderia pumila TaxID=1090375 RepID=A0ABR5HL63_9BURK|nr:ABC transporter ATP-binding protein YvcR [Candidatus Burkholderia pumila]